MCTRTVAYDDAIFPNGVLFMHINWRGVEKLVSRAVVKVDEGVVEEVCFGTGVD